MTKFRVISPAGEIMQIRLSEEGPDYIGGSESLVHLLKSKLRQESGATGKPIDPDRLNAADAMKALNSGGWVAKLTEGDLGEEVGETLGGANPVKEPIDLEEALGESFEGVFDDMAAGVQTGFIQAIQGADSFDEIQEIFYDAIDELLSIEQKAAVEYGVKAGQGEAARRKINAEVIQLLDSIEDARELSDEERSLLAGYTGRGGLKGENSETEYYTPEPVADATWEMLKVNGFAGGSVGEPSCGTGIFLQTKPAKTKVVANELSSISSKVAGLLHQDDDVQNVPFEEQAANMPDGSLDSAIGNVPFSLNRPYKQKDPAYAERNMTLEQYFIERMVDKVRAGGLVGLLIPTSVIERKSKQYREYRRGLSLKAEFLGAVRLPSGTFKKGQQGTEVPVDVILLKKHPEDLAEKIRHADTDTLARTGVYFEDFISGKWFETSGKRFLIGSQSREGQWSRLKVKFDGSDSERQQAIRQALSTKFDSRIDWAALNAAPVSLPHYAEGDRQYINGELHELENGKWTPVSRQIDENDLDESLYGAGSLSVAIDQLRQPETALTFTYDQVNKINETWPALLRTEAPRTLAAYQFASECDLLVSEMAWRGSLIGQIIDKYSVSVRMQEEDAEHLEKVQRIVSKEIADFGNPHRAKVKRRSKLVRDWMTYQHAVNKNGGYGALLRGEVEVATVNGFDSSDPVSIIHHLTAQTIQLHVDVDDVIELYTGTPEIKGVMDLILDDRIALTATGGVMTMEHYLAGDLYKKLGELNHLIAKEPNMAKRVKYEKQRQYILDNRPFTHIQDISLGFQDHWLDEKYIEEFLDLSGIPFVFDEDVQKWVTTESQPQHFEKQLLKHLNKGWVLDKGEWRKLKGGGNIRSSDLAQSADYRQQYADLKDQFNQFIRDHEDSQLIAEQYNAVFNTHMPIEYSEAPLGLKNLSGDIAPHGFQNSTVRRISDDGKGIIGLDVGLGKTFTALALVQYNIQNNRSNRACIAVPLSVLANWYHEARAIHKSLDHYEFIGVTPVRGDDGEILREQVFTEKKDSDGNPIPKMIKGKPVYQDVLQEDSADRIREKMWEIPQSNKKVFVMAQTVFGRIPLRPETQAEYADEMVQNEMISNGTATEYLISAAGGTKEEREAAIKSLKESEGKKDFTYEDAKKLSKAMEKHSGTGTKKSAAFPFYEDMRFDSCVVDEAHYFKNIYEASETRNLKYLAATDASDRGTDMAIKMNYMKRNNDGRGPVMLTATPITNSPIEVYNALSLVTDMSELERMGVKTPDDFVNVFAKTGNVEVQKLSGEMVEVDGITGFKNLQALRNLFARFAVVKKANEVTFDSGIAPPEANEQHAETDLDEEQQAAYEELRGELELAVLKMSDPENPLLFDEDGKPLPVKPIFSIMRSMEMATTDIDLLYKRMTFRFPAKHKKLVSELVSAGIPKSVTGKRFDPEKEKQVNTTIKRPESIEIQADGGLISFQIPVEFEPYILKRLNLPKFEKLRASVSHPVSSKYARLIENVNRHIAEKGKQIVFTEEKRDHGKLMRILVANTELSPSDIAIINADTAGDPDALQGISDAYNRGDIKLVIANQKAEVGVNLQRGTSAIHHLTLPWTPASIQQRNGRGVRQGNERESVDVYYYVARGSMDINRLGALKAKANWIGELMDSDSAAMDNPDASAEAGSELMKMALGEEGYKAYQTKQKAKLEAKRKASNNRNAMLDLSKLAKVNQKKANNKKAIEARLAKATSVFNPPAYKGDSEGFGSLEEAKAFFEKMADSHSRKDFLKETITALEAELEQSNAKLTRQAEGIKGRLKARDSLPFGEDAIESNLTSVFVHKEGGFALYEGCYIRIVPFMQKVGGQFDGRAICQVSSINPYDKTVHLSNRTGGGSPWRLLEGNSRSFNEVRFARWPKEWRPVPMTPEFALEMEIAKMEGRYISSFMEKYSREDLIRFGRPNLAYSGSLCLALSNENDEGMEIAKAVSLGREGGFKKVVFPDVKNDYLVDVALGLARSKFNHTEASKWEIKDFLQTYVGSDGVDRFLDLFKLKSEAEAEAELTKAMDDLTDSAPDEVLANDEELWKWLSADVDLPDGTTGDRILLPKHALLEKYQAEEFGNYDQLVKSFDRFVVRAKMDFSRRSDVARRARELQEAEQARIAKEAEEARLKEERDAQAEVESNAFVEAGGSQLTDSQKAAFKRLDVEVEVITKEWEYPAYKRNGKGREIKGQKFPAGLYLKAEGVGQKGFLKAARKDEIAERFAVSHSNQNGLYRYPRKMSNFIGREGDEITMLPINDLAEDIPFYLGLFE